LFEPINFIDLMEQISDNKIAMGEQLPCFIAVGGLVLFRDVFNTEANITRVI